MLNKTFQDTGGIFMNQQYSVTKHVKGKYLNYDGRMFIQIRDGHGEI